ncbi:MAG: histidine--tRNA ligase [Clostridia bacterium]
MALITQAPKGTQDLMPEQTAKWQTLEYILADECSRYGIKEIRTPVFEHTELFLRGVGDTTDVVEKQMYTFEDKGNRSITLRPEGTAGAVRAMLQSGIFNKGFPQKFNYFTSCYRYEKPQAGRLREFHQFGVEIFGTKEPVADADLIRFVSGIFDRLGLKDISLEINSIGCPVCRAKFNQALKDYFNANKEELCETCNSRLERNPMRILDCKSPVCAKIAEKAPVILDYLCDDCKEHFETVKEYLDIFDIAFTVNPSIVRGLDYYTRTVFEFVAEGIGAKSTVCGGGRYDGLVEEMGGKDTPALGFGMGLERLLLTLESQGIDLSQEDECEVYIASMGKEANKKSAKLANTLRDCGVYAEYDLCTRGLKAQMKYASKIGAKYSIVIGEEELQNNTAEMKNMETGEKVKISIGEDFIDDFITETTKAMDLNDLAF